MRADVEVMELEVKKATRLMGPPKVSMADPHSGGGFSLPERARAWRVGKLGCY